MTKLANSTEMLSRLSAEAEQFNINGHFPKYIGDAWFWLAFSSVHSEVCGTYSWPHLNDGKCNERRKPESFNQTEWDEGSIGELAMDVLNGKILGERQVSVILGSVSDFHARNLMHRKVKQHLYRVQIREREAGRVTERLTKIFDKRGQYFGKNEKDGPFFSRDGNPVEISDPDPHPICHRLLMGLPIRVSVPIDSEGGSPYSHSTLKIAATKILEAVRAVGKWAIFDIFEEVLAHHQNVALCTGMQTIRADGLNFGVGQGQLHMDPDGLISFYESALSENMISVALEFANNISNSWSANERQTWALRGASAQELDLSGISRQTRDNRLKSLVTKIYQECIAFIENSNLFLDEFSTNQFVTLVIQEIPEFENVEASHE